MPPNLTASIPTSLLGHKPITLKLYLIITNSEDGTWKGNAAALADILGYKAGRRPIHPAQRLCRHAYETLAKAGLITIKTIHQGVEFRIAA